VSRLEQSLVLVVATMMSAAGLSLAAQEAANAVSTAKDLTAVIALQGQPCGQVIGAVEQSEGAFLATCQDGNRYRVFVNADGRVIVAKQNQSAG